MGLGVGITVWMARYLGPEQFGVFNYALSFVILFTVLINLGLENIVVKTIINSPSNEGETLASSLLLRAMGGCVFFISTITLINYIRPNDSIVHHLVIILSIGYLFKIFEAIRYWFEAHVKAKFSSIIEVLALTTSVVIKAILILNDAPLIYFAWAVVGEMVVMALGLSVLFMIKYGKPLKTLKPKRKRVQSLFYEAWPLTLASALYMIAAKIDQIMLGNMIDSEAVGVYAAAVKLSEGWFFIPAVIATSLYPTMLSAKKNSRVLYIERTQHLLNLMAIIGISAAIFVILIANPLVNFVFGTEYQQSASVLIVHILGGIFVAISGISYRYLISEGLQKYSLYRGLTGVVVNIIMNFFMIPQYGVMGAAISTVVSQFMALYLFNISRTETKELFYMQSKALSLTGSVATLRHYKTKIQG
ncbi:hypothetical protein ST37_04065 [Vibrio sp. qd031]|nr:hypothetical protein ST37_04065 [Vibrio sp. qd031]